jgi:hypothetical protein
LKLKKKEEAKELKLKRQKEEERRRKAEERKKLNAHHLKIATEFYNKKTVQKIFFKGLMKLLEQKSMHQYLWSKFREKQLIVRGFKNLYQAYAIARTQRETEEEKTVASFKQYMLKKKGLTALKNIQIIEQVETLKLQELWAERRVKNIFSIWREMVPQLRKENLEREDKLELVVKKFRLTVVGPEILKGWKKYVRDEKEEKEKEKFKKEMWNKVSSWLDEIDQKEELP